MATNKPTPQQVGGGILVALLLAFGVSRLTSDPPAPKPPGTTITITTAAPTSTSTTAAPAGARRWFADSATWNQPVSAFGPSTSLQSYAQRLWTYGGGAAPPGTISTAFSDYSIPIYPASSATTTARVYQVTWAQAMYGMGTVHIGDKIPWNPAWKPGTGNDNLMAIVDEQAGRVWELGGVGQLDCINGANLLAAIAANDPNSVQLCLYGANTYTGLYNATDGTTVDGRGMGINKLALITRAAEVKSGAIRHALEMTITSTMFGQPACTPTKGAGAPGAGVSCGFYVPPATKLERAVPNAINCPVPTPITDAERSKTVPEGMRFALRITNAEITQWLDARHYTGPLRETARVFAVALRDYGWIVAETGCWGMHIETDSVIGAAGPTWASLGVTADGTGYPKGDLLAGLITAERIYVVEPPA